MTTEQKKEELKRESILDLLTETEMAKVSSAEDTTQLTEGDEYVDLENLESGVHQVQQTPLLPPGHALPRSAVSDVTWARIVRAVAT